jgi:hypothetical protein
MRPRSHLQHDSGQQTSKWLSHTTQVTQKKGAPATPFRVDDPISSVSDVGLCYLRKHLIQIE